MIEENALVVGLEDDQVLLQTQRRSACQACSVRQGCGTSVLAKVVGQRSSQIRLDNSLGAKIGDEVVLGIQENAMVQGSLLVYALPLLMMLVFALAGEWWAGQQQMNSEWLVILSGFFGFVSAMLITRYIVSRSRLRQQIQPRMLRIIGTVSGRHDTMLVP